MDAAGVAMGAFDVAHLVGPDGGHVHGAAVELRDRG